MDTVVINCGDCKKFIETMDGEEYQKLQKRVKEIEGELGEGKWTELCETCSQKRNEEAERESEHQKIRDHLDFFAKCEDKEKCVDCNILHSFTRDPSEESLEKVKTIKDFHEAWKESERLTLQLSQTYVDSKKHRGEKCCPNVENIFLFWTKRFSERPWNKNKE